MSILARVAQRLLLGKSLLSRIRVHPVSQPDQHSLANHIITAHDAAELILAAIADHKRKLPPREQHYLMDYFEPLKGLHPERDVTGREFFRQLNRVRIDIKHYGIFPDPKQWARVAETTYGYASQWCSDYLGTSLDEIDDSALLRSDTVRTSFNEAKQALTKRNYQKALEQLGIALHQLFEENDALRNVQVGKPRSEDAIRLTGFGVHANDFLALQEFLPSVLKSVEGSLTVQWEQNTFGHPGNWRKNAVQFCLGTFLDVALKIQDAQWIPGALYLQAVYEHKATALKDGVEVWTEVSEGSSPFEILSGSKIRKETSRTLSKGESLRGSVVPHRRKEKIDSLTSALAGRDVGPIETISIHFKSDDAWHHLYMNRDDVKVTLVPRDTDFVRNYFQGLPEVDWEPD